MADQILTQADFGYGMFSETVGPKNSAYTLLNVLVDDAGRPSRRGGADLYSTSDAGQTLTGLADVFMAAGQKTILWGATGMFTLDGGLAPVAVPNVPAASAPPAAGARLEVMDGAVIWLPQGAYAGSVHAWAGSAKTAQYATGTVAVTANSATVTGTGTAWLANVDAGMILRVGASGSETGTAVVKSVDSDTQITLTRPWSFDAGTGLAYALDPLRNVGAPHGGAALSCMALVANRLLVGAGNRVYFTDPFKMAFRTGDFHEMPSGAQVTGIAGLGPDTAVVFTTLGAFTISGLAFDPIDPASGDQQHTVSRVSRDLILWGEQGIAGWAGGLVVPGISDVVVLTPDGGQATVSEGVRRPYRALVEGGNRPGTAVVYRGHYILPIVSQAGSVVSTLVCRLDRGSAWTGWSGSAAGVALAVRVGSTVRDPQLFGLNSQRVTELTGCFTPVAANKQDLGSSTHTVDLVTRMFDLAQGAGLAHVEKVRVRYSLVDAASDNPTVSVQWARDPAAAFTNATLVRGGGESDGTDYSVWRIEKRAERMMLKIVLTGPAASFVVHEIEVFVRKAGF